MTGVNLSQSKNRILWANRIGETLAEDIIPCFPSVELSMCALNREEVDFLMTELSPIYDTLLDSLAKSVSSAADVDVESCQIVLRESLVLVTYALVDRMLRLFKVISQNNCSELSVATVNDVPLVKSNAHFIGLVDGSQEFNQQLLCRLASSIWQLPVLKLNKPLMADVKNTKPINNLNFDIPNLFQRIKRKTSRMLSARLGRLPALRLANIETNLLDGGLYGIGKLMWLPPLTFEISQERDLFLRRRLFSELYEEVGDALCKNLFIRQVGMDAFTAKRASEVFCEWLIEFIPTDRLEAISHSLLRHHQRLESLHAPALFFCGMPGANEIYWIAAARELNIPVIGVQHGAHYGFVNQSCFVELELAYCDYFVTWGWQQLPAHPLCQDVQTIELPSPWLTERARAWKKVSVLRSGDRFKRSHDVLIMSDRVQPFPPTISTMRTSRRDFLGQLNSTIWEIVSELVKRQIRVLNKPFNYTSRDLQSDVLNRLEEKYPDDYCEVKKLDKGLTLNLLNSAWIILWDEPGTGFFECLLSGIPTVALWERLTSREEEYARPYFKELEDVGLLHNSVSSLVDVIQEFLNDPEDWIANKDRLDAIRKITVNYAKTDAGWSARWRKFVKGLPIKIE